MATAIYPAVIERAGDGYSVFFPDLPGCISAGDTLQEAALNAEEALSGHIQLSLEYGDNIAEPRNLDDIEVDPEIDEVARVLVRVELPGKSVRVNITLDEGLLAAIDQTTSNRSAFLASAARRELGSYRKKAG